MSSSHHPSELDSATDSRASTPRSDHHHPPYDSHGLVRFMCSFGGNILPRPQDNQLRYLGGETRIVVVPHTATLSAFMAKLSKVSGIAVSNLIVKYQLPNEDLDALISVTTDEDVENLMDEYDRIAQGQTHGSGRLRLFLYSKTDSSAANSISTLLEGSANRDRWFLDALNSGGAASASRLERGRSEASSILSEVPDYLFGLDNPEETQPRDPKVKTRPALNENVPASDPGSPALVVSSPFSSTCSAPIVPSMPDLPPVKTKPESPDPVMDSKQQSLKGSFIEQPAIQATGYTANPMWHYVPDSQYSGPSVHQLPVYYVPGPAPPGNVPVQPVPIRAQYVQHYPLPAGQVQVGYHHQPIPPSGQTYRPAAAMDPYDPAGRGAPIPPNLVNQRMFYGVRSAGSVPVYSDLAVPGEKELNRTGSDATAGRISQSG